MKDYRPEPRIIIEMDGGLINRVIADGVDLSNVRVFIVDYDIEGADEEELQTVDEAEACVRVEDATPATEDEHREFGRMHQTWATT